MKMGEDGGETKWHEWDLRFQASRDHKPPMTPLRMSNFVMTAQLSPPPNPKFILADLARHLRSTLTRHFGVKEGQGWIITYYDAETHARENAANWYRRRTNQRTQKEHAQKHTLKLRVLDEAKTTIRISVNGALHFSVGSPLFVIALKYYVWIHQWLGYDTPMPPYRLSPQMINGHWDVGHPLNLEQVESALWTLKEDPMTHDDSVILEGIVSCRWSHVLMAYVRTPSLARCEERSSLLKIYESGSIVVTANEHVAILAEIYHWFSVWYRYFRPQLLPAGYVAGQPLVAKELARVVRFVHQLVVECDSLPSLDSTTVSLDSVS